MSANYCQPQIDGEEGWEVGIGYVRNRHQGGGGMAGGDRQLSVFRESGG